MTLPSPSEDDGRMQNPILTNSLLFIVAILMLVQVIQTGRLHDQLLSPTMVSSMASPHSAHGDGGSPSTATTPPMATEMVFHAMVGFPKGCNKQGTLSACNSPEAEAVKQQINSWAAGGKGIRQIFDQIVETFGEAALTEEARQIRAQRRRAN